MAGEEFILSLPFYFISAMDEKLKADALEILHNYTDTNKEKFDAIVEVFEGEFGKENVDGTVSLATEEQIIALATVLSSGPNNYTQEAIMQEVRDAIRRSYENALSIIIRFPVVRVTNEEDKYVIIKDLYALVNVERGLLHDSFRLQRTTFSKQHWQCGYAHSHLPELLGWQHPCLGTGPIASTQSNLRGCGHIELWGLFAYELGKYVTVESLQGVPYKRLESIGEANGIVSLPNNIRTRSSIPGIAFIYRFLSEWLQNNTIKMGYRNGQFTLGEDLFLFWVRLSKDFISWFNRYWYSHFKDNDTWDLDRLQREYILMKCVIIGRRIYNWGRSGNRELDVPTEARFKFKGQDVFIKVEDDTKTESEPSQVYLISDNIMDNILTILYECANYKQRKEGSEEDSASGKEYQIF